MQKSPLYAVFNANSEQAKPIVEEAARQGLNVRAISKSEPDKFQWSHPEKIETKKADLNSFWETYSALKGVKAAFWHLPAPKDAKSPGVWIKNLIFAAHMRRLKLLVVSTSGPTCDELMDAELVRNNKRLEDGLLKSGLKVIVLRPTIYLENFKSPTYAPSFVGGEDLVYPPISDSRKMSYTSHKDQAIAAVAALQRTDLAGQCIDIASKGSPTGGEIVDYWNELKNNQASFLPLNPADFGAHISNITGTNEVGNMLAEFYQTINAASKNALVVDTNAAEKLLGVKFGSWQSRMAEWQ